MKKRRRRRKKHSPVRAVLAVLGVVILAAALVGMGFALRGGYETYVKSTYKIEHLDTVLTACEDFGIEPTLALGIIRTESGFNEQAHSSADARGLMQVTAVGLEWAQIRTAEFDEVTVDQLYEPTINIRLGVYLLSLLFEQFENEDAVIAAYNAGIGNVERWLADTAYSADGVHLDTIPYEETRNYIRRVKSSKAIYEYYYQIGSATTATKGDS